MLSEQIAVTVNVSKVPQNPLNFCKNSQIATPTPRYQSEEL